MVDALAFWQTFAWTALLVAWLFAGIPLALLVGQAGAPRLGAFLGAAWPLLLVLALLAVLVALAAYCLALLIACAVEVNPRGRGCHLAERHRARGRWQ